MSDLEQLLREGPADSALAFEAADEIADLKAQLAEAKEQAHYANGVADLAMKHRDAAEAKLASARKALETISTALPHPDKSVLLIQFTSATKLAAETLLLTDENGT